MNADNFWTIIEVGKNSDSPEVALAQELAKQAPEEIVAFQAIFDSCFDEAYKWDLWGAAYLIGGGCSDDGFIDFRYGLISAGRDVYEHALVSADSLADLGDQAEIENESFGYVAHEVYENKTSKEIHRKASFNSSEPIGEEWDFDDESENSRRLPRLSSLYQ